MAITSAERTKILQLIVGMFNAAPGELYLNQIAAAYEADGHNLLTLAKQLSGTGAFASIYPAFMTGSEFATAFLAPLGLDDVPSVFNWIKGRYESGENKGTIIFDAMAALVASTSVDPQVVEAQAILNNKVEVAEYYSVTKGLSDPDLADLQLVLAGVDATDASVDAAIAVIDGQASAGTTFTLTHAQDHIVGTELNDTINAIVDGEFSTDNTFTLGDSVEGNGGFDLFAILTDQLEVNFLGKTVTEVEAFQLDVVNGEDFDLLNLNNVAFESAVVNFNGADELDGMTIDNVNKGTALEVNDIALDGNTIDINYAGAGVIGNSLSLNNVTEGEVDVDFNQGDEAGGVYTLNLDGVSDLYIDLNGSGAAQTLNVNVNGDSDVSGISNYADFDGGEAIVNLVLNGDLSAEWWDLADDADTTTFNITGSGNLTIDDFDDGNSDTTVAGAAATGDIDITSWSETIVSVTTGSGDDRLALAIDDSDVAEDDRLYTYFTADSTVAVDLGAGANTLAIVQNNNEGEDDGVFDSAEINSLVFSAGTFLNAQTLELTGDVNLDDTEGTTLALDGLAVVDTVQIDGSVQGNGNTLIFPAAVADDPDTEDDDETAAGSPADLTVNVDGSVDWLHLNTGDIVTFAMNAGGEELDIDSVTSETTESLTFTLADSGVEGDDDFVTDNLWLDLDGNDGNLASLVTLVATSGDNAHVDIVGDPGAAAIPADPGTSETGSFDFSNYTVVKAAKKSKAADFTGSVQITSADLPGGALLVDVSGANNATDVAAAVAAALDGLAEITASNTGDTVDFAWVAAGNMEDLTVTFIPTGAADDNVDVSAVDTVDGTDPTAAVPAEGPSGFEALETVTVDAGEDADLNVTAAFGAFVATVTAGDDANVDLMDTGVTALTVTAGGSADVHIDGADDLGSVVVDAESDATVDIENAEGAFTVSITTHGDADSDDAGDVVLTLIDTGVTSVDVHSADYVQIDIENADDLASLVVAFANDEGLNSIDLVNTSSLALIDLSQASDIGFSDTDNVSMDVDAIAASFDGPVQILIGTEDLTYATLVGNAERETFTFTGADTGAVTIEGFFTSVGGTGDRIDFSQMAGIDNIDDLEIVVVGSDTHVTSLVDGVDVDITVVGVNLTDDVYHFVF